MYIMVITAAQTCIFLLASHSNLQCTLFVAFDDQPPASRLHPTMSPAAKSRSLELQQTKGPVRAFFASQFCTKIKPVLLTPETSLAGQTALVTGSTTGLGLLASRQLLSLNLSRLILAVRSPEKGAKVAAQMRADYPSATIEVWSLEMGSYPSIQAFARRAAAEFSSPEKRLDIAILNAGLTHQNFTRCEATGHENIVQVNYLSTVLLALLLLPVLRPKVSAGSRVRPQPGRLTIVNSGTALFAKLPNRDKRPFLASYDDEKAWDGVETYSASKLLAHFFLIRLLDHLPADFSDEVIVNLVDPGFCKGTGLHTDVHGIASVFMETAKSLTGRALEDGAWTYVDGAVIQGKESHGCFIMDFEIRPFAPIIYEPNVDKLMDVLWDETLAELDFAGVNNILQGLKY